MAISMARAKALCNASELSLVRASTRTEIGKLSATRLKQKVARARSLRDKWSDQSRNQRRATQSAQRSRPTDANARSGEKAEIFAAALAQFESRLAKLESAGKVASPAIKKLAPRARSAKHRAARADIRGELKEERLELAKKKRPAKPKTKKTAPVEVFPESIDGESPSTQASPKPTAPPKRATSKKSHAGAGLSAMESARELQGLHVSKGQQLRARTAAKKSRLKSSGLLRVQKSTSAANKRRQAKRDAH
jgi:hypothetical protein